MQPTDQISTAREIRKVSNVVLRKALERTCLNWCLRTALAVFPPAQHDFGSTVPASGHITGHFGIGDARKTEIEDLQRKELGQAP